MASNKSSPKKNVAVKTADNRDKSARTSPRSSTIKPPPAPAVLQSDDVGAPLSLDRAIEEKVRLYPRAQVKEIVAMFELEGVRVAPAAVEKAQRKATP